MAYESYVLVCGGTACCSGGGDKIVEAFARELESAGLKEKVQVVTTGCLGCCGLAPVAVVNGEVHGKLETKDVDGIIAQYRKLG